MSKRANNLMGKEWAKYSISIWSDIIKSAEERKLKHPALFPKMLVGRILSCFTSNEEKVVLDPFMGSGSTLIAAKEINKTGIGFDINEDYVNLAASRLAKQAGPGEDNFRIYNTDAKELSQIIISESVDICVTSPPYWDILNQKRTADHKDIRNYGNLGADLSLVHNYAEFLNQLGFVFSEVYKVLKPGKYCVVNVMDLRKKNKFFPFHADLAAQMQGIGFIYDDIIIWDRRQEYNNLRTLGYPSVFRINKTHEYLLIFQKPF